MFKARVEKCRVVSEASFTIRGLTLMIGPNGAGKTTIVRALTGILRCACSLWDGSRDLCRLPPWERGIGYVPQSLALFRSMSVYDNIAFGLKSRGLDGRVVREKVEELARLVGVKHLLDRPAWALSGGEARRVALARALAIEPRLLIIDEAFDGIDPGTRAQLLRALGYYTRSRSIDVLLVTHYIHEVIAAVGVDHVVVVDSGRVVYDGPPSPSAVPRRLEHILGRFVEDGGRLYYIAPSGVKVEVKSVA